jgi:hypothetical protein
MFFTPLSCYLRTASNKPLLPQIEVEDKEFTSIYLNIVYAITAYVLIAYNLKIDNASGWARTWFPRQVIGLALSIIFTA